MKFPSLILWLSALPAAAQAAPGARPAPVSLKAMCGAPIPGLEETLRRSQFVVFGDIHGTAEIPAFYVRAVCQAARQGTPVRAAMEIATAEQERIDAFMNAPSPDTGALTAGPFWTDAYQDGRRSRAVLAAIVRLRELKRAGLSIEIAAFDPALPSPERDAYLAASLAGIRKRAPEARFMVLVGNLHARRDVGAPWNDKLEFMAHRLAPGEPTLLTLNVAFSGGAAWTCSGNDAASCGPGGFKGHPGRSPGITLKPDPSDPDGYQGTYFLGRLHASPPALPQPAAAARNR